MGVNVSRKSLLRRVAAVALFLVLGVSFWLWLAAPRETPGATAPAPAPAGQASLPPPALAPASKPSEPAPPPAQSLMAEPAEAPAAGYPVNMETLRSRIPDNLYWTTAAPTKDPRELQARAEQERRQNTLFGKIQAGDATEEEIHQYYDFRRKLSEDYLVFAGMLLSEYGSQLPERDEGVLELSVQMHRGRLKELPRQREEALARRELQERRREEWRRQGGGKAEPP
ncbi:hypothetical protein SAMN05444354_101630 [Stigmatella aurantiaca]|uniref:Uncharacterized protein n=1 Tax=Stigmatella aurantiaca TaxID=41 RepID=A0A1H7H6T9_STIAU|nr:hypothetical protein SAMN05444354_101630 [Stigmatella aurantiaca]